MLVNCQYELELHTGMCSSSMVDCLYHEGTISYGNINILFWLSGFWSNKQYYISNANKDQF